MYKTILFSFALCALFIILSGQAQAADTATSKSIATTMSPSTVVTTAAATTTIATSTIGIIATSSSSSTVSTSSSPIHDRVAIEKRVREYFVDAPIMVEIARCESNFREFNDNGSVFRGGAGGGMVGVFQFYEQVHKAAALNLGFDLSSLEGNLGYAKHLFINSGTAPWVACIPRTSTSTDANLQLRIELMSKLVGLLQQLLTLQLAHTY